MKGKVDYKKYLKETFTNKVNTISIKGYNKSYLKNDKKFSFIAETDSEFEKKLNLYFR